MIEMTGLRHPHISHLSYKVCALCCRRFKERRFIRYHMHLLKVLVFLVSIRSDSQSGDSKNNNNNNNNNNKVQLPRIA
jgi:hypothetical protein